MYFSSSLLHSKNQNLFERINKINTYRESLWKYFCLFLAGKHYSSNYGTSSWRSVCQAVPHYCSKRTKIGEENLTISANMPTELDSFFSSYPHANICGFSGLKACLALRPVCMSERLVISNKEQEKYIKYLIFKYELLFETYPTLFKFHPLIITTSFIFT